MPVIWSLQDPMPFESSPPVVLPGGNNRFQYRATFVGLTVGKQVRNVCAFMIKTPLYPCVVTWFTAMWFCAYHASLQLHAHLHPSSLPPECLALLLIHNQEHVSSLLWSPSNRPMVLHYSDMNYHLISQGPLL